MSEVIKNLAYLAIFTLAFSALTGCGGSAESIPANSPGTAASSEYPPFNSEAANAEMRHLDGSTSTVAQRKGKVVLVNMWATWCGPCREEMPELIKMQNEHGPKGFEVVGLNVDDEPEDMVRDFVNEMNLNYTITWGSERSEEHTSELQSRENLVCRLLLEKKKRIIEQVRGHSRPRVNADGSPRRHTRSSVRYRTIRRKDKGTTICERER